MANDTKKPFLWADADKAQAAAPATGGDGKKPFLWSDVQEPPTPASTDLEQGAPKATWTGSYNPNAAKYGPAVRALDAAGGAVLGTPGALLSTIAHPIDTAEGIGQSIGSWFDPKTRPTWEGIKSVLPEALGTGIGNVAAGEAAQPLAKLAGQGIGAGAKQIAKLGMDEAGQPKPLTKLALGGDRAEALSELTAPRDANGMPYQKKAEMLMQRGAEQDAIDEKAAVEARRADRERATTQRASDREDAAARKPQPITQSPNFNADAYNAGRASINPAPVAPPTPELGSPENPGFHSKVPTRMPERIAPSPELGSPDNPGFHSKLPTRMPAQVAAPEAEPELGSPDNPGWHSKVPTRMPKIAAPEADAAAGGTPRIVAPSDAGPKFTGSEGSPARWTNDRVRQLAAQGNREAIQQSVRRGFELPPNARYVAGDPDFSAGMYNPRDVTRFSPEGTPIRQGGKQLSRITLNPVGGSGARALVPDNQFESSFGPEHKEVGDLAEWETGDREGVRPKRIIAP